MTEPATTPGAPHAAPEPAPEPDDATLLRAHVEGDPEAFGRLIARHRDRMWAIALRTMRNPDDAADALQDACVSAFRRASGFRGDAQVTTWLHRIVVNACLDRLRRMKVRRADPLPDDPDRSPELAAELSRAADTDDPAVRSEETSEVVAALRHLNPDQRAALVLVDMEGYSVEEAAAMLGCAAGTVKSRCARGRAKLAPLLAHLRIEDEPGDADPDATRPGPAPAAPPRVGTRRAPVPSGSDPPRAGTGAHRT
ncbi:RNA polymerase sigma-70 factor (ECF subfamily) [Friedmanniella endophytica]|uniref:RNA polymerase sigma-70 factor (ECF subfamily) n=1 Tax=Microlunatus kandeliicorticis TaxID=1759536 RepID=A0A7W3IQY9_9ACTN|nr:RNA polymerase sigma factor SigM [Microlunatus kandeliicorticis]MBA8793611.1 RNA polymerase sigma-70 factor (ECF subfamily) [Microlunatus kandeliicorticis]